MYSEYRKSILTKLQKFAQKDNSKEDIEKVQSAIIKKGDACLIYRFATDVKGADIDRLQDALIKLECSLYDSNSKPLYIFYFAKNVKGANIEKLQDAIIKTGDTQYIYEFAREIYGADIDKLQQAVIKAHGYLRDCNVFKFARDVKGADVEKLENEITKSDYLDIVCKFASEVPGADINKLHNAIVATGDKEYIEKFEKMLDEKETIIDDADTTWDIK